MRLIKDSVHDRGSPVVAVDAQRGGDSIEELRLACMKAGAYVNRRRKRKGVNPRAIRTIVLGFPNVGKSSIINRLSGRKVAMRMGTPGTTRNETWHRVGGFRNTEMEFLDMPGTIPVCYSKRYSEEQGFLLAMCRVFPDHIIDRQRTAEEMVMHMAKLQKEYPHMVESTVWRETQRMYKVNFQQAVQLKERMYKVNFQQAV